MIKSASPTKNPMNEQMKELYEKAKKVREHSHSPYSKQKVGAAIKLKSGEIFQGCNVENASFGATTCAEQVAIFSAVASVGKKDVAEVMVVTDASPPWPPCGMCRQVLSEFGKDITIHAANLNGELHTVKLIDLFPAPFTPDSLE